MWTKFCHFLTPAWTVFYLERGQKQTFLIPSPPHLVHVVIECPLMHYDFDTIFSVKYLFLILLLLNSSKSLEKKSLHYQQTRFIKMYHCDEIDTQWNFWQCFGKLSKFFFCLSFKTTFRVI